MPSWITLLVATGLLTASSSKVTNAVDISASETEHDGTDPDVTKTQRQLLLRTTFHAHEDENAVEDLSAFREFNGDEEGDIEIRDQFDDALGNKHDIDSANDFEEEYEDKVDMDEMLDDFDVEDAIDYASDYEVNDDVDGEELPDVPGSLVKLLGSVRGRTMSDINAETAGATIAAARNLRSKSLESLKSRTAKSAKALSSKGSKKCYRSVKSRGKASKSNGCIPPAPTTKPPSSATPTVGFPTPGSYTPTASASPTPTTPKPALKSGNTFPAIGGQTTNMHPQGGRGPNDVVCGAVQSVLVHPSDANVCFAGATNGGVWRTNSCKSAEPEWTPLTDKEASNSVGDMTFDDNNPQKLIVAIGTRSSFARIGGPGIGLLLTDNALDSTPVWTNLDNGGLFRQWNIKFNSVYMRGDLILASAYGSLPRPTGFWACEDRGIWRSTNRGATWTNVLPGIGRAIADDPNNPSRFYATLDRVRQCSSNKSLPENGVFVSYDSGANWWPTTSQSAPLQTGELNNAKLSVSRDDSRIWSAILKNGQADSIAFSDNNGNSWTKMDAVRTEECITPDDCTPSGLNPRMKPGSAGAIHFSLLASDTNKNDVFVGGDRQDKKGGWPNFIGATDYTGRLFRGNASVESTGDRIPSAQWDHMTDLNNITEIRGGGTASNSAPHADSRDMKLRADGAILEGNDGGIVVRTSPNINTGDWFGVCGNMQVFEVHSLAYEPVFKKVLYANQDTGTILGELGKAGDFSSISKADGGLAMIDYKSDSNFIFYYHSAQYANNFQVRRVDRTSGSVTDTTFVPKVFDASFVPVTAMDPNDQTKFAFGAGPKPKSSTLPQAPPGSVMVYKRKNNFGSIYFDGYFYQVFQGGDYRDYISAMAYSSDGRFLYAASTKGNSGEVKRCNTDPTTGSLVGCPIIADAITLGGSVIRHMAVDPNKADRIVVVAVERYINPRVFESVNAGVSWKDVTVDGSPIDMAYNGHSVAFLSQEKVSFLVVGTSKGIYLHTNDSWHLLADGLPTVPVFDMIYSSEDDRLVIATLGRGVWYLDRAFHVANIAQGGVVDFSPFDVKETAGITFDFPEDTLTFPPDDYDDQEQSHQVPEE